MYEAILADEQKVLAIVKEECIKMRDKYGDERRTEISIVSGEVDIEDLIPEEECVLTLTNLGYIKRQPVDSYTAQRRGGKGIKALSTREEDVTKTMYSNNNPASYLMRKPDGTEYWEGITFPLIEQ